jgi:DNA end-binding protein Ku
VGVARYVFHNRGHIGILKPHNQVLVLNQLRYESEINKPSQLHIPESAKMTKQEVSMALKLIEQLTTHFQPEEYHDTYTEELKEIIAEKAKGKKPPRSTKGKEPKVTDVKDIMRMLKESLESHQRKSA